MLVVARRYHTPWLLLLAVFALATAAWLARPEMPHAESNVATHGDALAIAAHAHASVATMATRAPLPCARSEQPWREVVHLDACVTGPADATRPARTPLYALLRVFRL